MGKCKHKDTTIIQLDSEALPKYERYEEVTCNDCGETWQRFVLIDPEQCKHPVTEETPLLGFGPGDLGKDLPIDALVRCKICHKSWEKLLVPQDGITQPAAGTDSATP